MRLRVLPANCMFRVVAVPPGAPLVTFRYDPMPLKAGFLASGFGAGWLAVRGESGARWRVVVAALTVSEHGTRVELLEAS